MNDRVLIIGAGLGGLTAAAVLAHRGYRVTVLEAQPTLGGKLQHVAVGGHKFDFGPSTITMPEVFLRVWELCGQSPDPALVFTRLHEHSHNVFADGTTIRLPGNTADIDDALHMCSASDRAGWKRLLTQCGQMHTIAKKHFFPRHFATWTQYASPALAVAMLRVRPHVSMHDWHRAHVRDPRLCAMLDRYATYVGSHPKWTPATLSMIFDVEHRGGVYWIQGGTYTLVSALAALARSQGAHIVTQARVTRIDHAHGRVRGVHTSDGTHHEADVVISNADDVLLDEWLGLPRAPQHPRSLSGIVTLAAVAKTWPSLGHHNLFYPHHPAQEFDDIFVHHRLPTDPTIYVCFSGATERSRASGGTNMYIMTNAPAFPPTSQDTHTDARAYHDRVISTLEHRYGLDGLRAHIVEKQTITPQDIAASTNADRGALYGQASHGMLRTFFRPRIKKHRVHGLYACGGTVHPGGGSPMVVMSGMLTAEAVSARTK
jgi:phytoene desaturase